MENKEEGSSRLDDLVAILIAVVVVIGAVVAWRASVIDDGAGDADYAGLRSAIYAEKTRALNYVNAYESYGNYVAYWRNNRLAQLLEGELETADEETALALSEQLSTANDLADANRTMFETRYLNRDGSYSVQRQLGEMWADASRKNDLAYEGQFQEADQGRARSLRMLVALMVLTVAPVLFSLVESVGKRAKVLLAGGGVLITLAGIVLALIVQFGK